MKLTNRFLIRHYLLAIATDNDLSEIIKLSIEFNTNNSFNSLIFTHTGHD